MHVLTCNMTIGAITFEWVTNLEIDTGWELLTDKTKIVLPSNVKLDRHRLSEFIKFGDYVVLKAGYDGNLNTIYAGYVVHVKPRVPIEISCEDEMWKLKQSTLKDSGKDMTLESLLAKHFSGYKTRALNVEMGTYYIDNISRAQLLEKLKSDFGLYAFFRDGVLVVGLQYDPETAQRHSFRLEYNMVKDDLEFRRKDQIKLKVRAISNNSNGTKTEIELGDPDGEGRTLNFYNLSEQELKAAAEREMSRLLYDGWRGKFTAFGEPFVQHGDIVSLTYNDESEKAGSYWVDAVKYEFGVGGFRQDIKLGPRV